MRRLITLAALLGATAPANADTWFAAVDRYAQHANPSAAGYMDLFQPDAPWHDIHVFKTSTQFLHQATDTEVSAMIGTLRTKHVALAMEGLLLVESERCGRGVESYGGRGAVPALAERVRRLGGEIAYVAMDEPLWYGNFMAGGRHCHDSIESLAEQLVPSVRALKSAFPAIEFGDIEPINDKTPGRIDVMLRFAQAFREKTGEPLSFVHADIQWRSNWHPQLKEWKAKAHAARLRLGVICNGSQDSTSDEEWVAQALDRCRIVTTDPAISPADVIVQTWMARPSAEATAALATAVAKVTQRPYQ